MTIPEQPTSYATTVENRRMALLNMLAKDAHPLTILYGLEQAQSAVFIIHDDAAYAIRRGLADPRRRVYESNALATVRIAAETPDRNRCVYQIESFHYENLGNSSTVLAVDRDWLNAGEIEVHTHVYATPDYLGQVDVGDLIAAVEGSAWIPPQGHPMNPAIRIFGILSVYETHVASLQFYIHDLLDDLDRQNHYGLKTLGKPITLIDAY